MQKILIFSEQKNSRLQYTLHVLLKQLLGLEFDVTTSLDEFEGAKIPKINYSSKLIKEATLSLVPNLLLFQQNISAQSIEIAYKKDLPLFFRTTEKSLDFPADIFAMSFYLLSRYEEYLPFNADQHGRFTAKNSLAYQHQFLEKPIVNQWAIWLGKLLKKKFPSLKITLQEYQFQPTFDIDLAWAFKCKGFARTLGGSLLDLKSANFHSFFWRWQVLMNWKTDPFDVYDELQIWHNELSTSPRFFFLLGDYGEFDKNCAPNNKKFQQLIRHLAQQYDVGIHPSYGSNSSIKQLKKEKRRLENMVQDDIRHSRQHFLKVHIPTTYRNLLEVGITNDYSMGYAEQIGFRASIANPFPWYDLEREKMTKLMIHPFQIMDVTLKEYLNLHPEEATQRIQTLIETTRAVGGTFTSLWHNSSFSKIGDWEEWRIVYQTLLKAAKKTNN